MRVFGPTNTRSTTGAPSPVISSLVAANSAGTPLFSGAGDRNGANPVSIFRPGNPSGSSPSFPKLFLRRTPLQAEAKHNAVLEVASRRLSGWMDDSLIMYGDTYRFATVRTLVSGMKTFHQDRRLTE